MEGFSCFRIVEDDEEDEAALEHPKEVVGDNERLKTGVGGGGLAILEQNGLNDRLGDPEEGVANYVENKCLFLTFLLLPQPDRVGHVFLKVTDGEDASH